VIVALNKIDMLDDELIAALSAELEEESGAEVIPISGASGRRRLGARPAARSDRRPQQGRRLATMKARMRSNGRRDDRIHCGV
jgi:Fe2+ transport system protein B